VLEEWFQILVCLEKFQGHMWTIQPSGVCVEAHVVFLLILLCYNKYDCIDQYVTLPQVTYRNKLLKGVR